MQFQIMVKTETKSVHLPRGVREVSPHICSPKLEVISLFFSFQEGTTL